MLEGYNQLDIPVGEAIPSLAKSRVRLRVCRKVSLPAAVLEGTQCKVRMWRRGRDVPAARPVFPGRLRSKVAACPGTGVAPPSLRLTKMWRGRDCEADAHHRAAFNLRGGPSQRYKKWYYVGTILKQVCEKN